MRGYPIAHPNWQGSACLMCSGTGQDRAYVMGPPSGAAGIRPVIGYAVINGPCRACNGHGKEPS